MDVFPNLQMVSSHHRSESMTLFNVMVGPGLGDQLLRVAKQTDLGLLAPLFSAEASSASCPLNHLLFTIYYYILSVWLLVLRVKTRGKRTPSRTHSSFFYLHSKDKEYYI